MVIVLGILPLASLYLLKLIIDSVTQLDFSSKINLFDPHFSTPLLYISLACGIGVLTAFFNFISDYLKKAQSLTVTDHMLSVLHEKSIRTDLEYFESSEYHDTLYRAQREGPYRPTNIVNGLFTAGQNGVSFAAVFGLLFIFNPYLSIIMVAAAIPGVWLRLKYSEKIYSWQKKRTEDERRSNYFHTMLTGGSHAKEFRLFNLGSHFIERFKQIRQTLKKEKLFFEKRRALGDFIAQSSMTITVFGSFVYIALKTVQGSVSLGEMIMYFQAFQRGLFFLKTLLENGAQMYEDNLFLSHFYDFLNITPRIKTPKSPMTVPNKNEKGIEFKNITFFYPNCEKNVLKNVNFSIMPGETVALVGENGSGKSTLAKLLARLYEPQHGEIFFEGTNIKKFRPQEYRKMISVVFQDHNRYNLTIRENIYMGNLENRKDTDSIQRAAKETGIHSMILNFPHDYDTMLGKWFKTGEELSVGQWQMLAIARAFFREARLIIMDEPSSALDPETEMNIFSKLKRLIRDRSALIISHRYSTVKMADKILVLDKGRIAEQGGHSDLLEKGGIYARLYRTQADGYISS
ncbi:MAG: ABC transporter ATP-binding protein/permease, partial [Desulfobacterales bacterium]|nr:ABC transporter ATP-binding protein/permease [Desulfobacterales bacterium]